MQKAIAKVGRNRVEVEVIEQTESGYRVRSLKSGREFTVAKLEPAAKRLPLLEAAIQALRAQPPGTALNTRELVELAVTDGLWANNGAKTPEQTLLYKFLAWSKIFSQWCVPMWDIWSHPNHIQIHITEKFDVSNQIIRSLTGKPDHHATSDLIVCFFQEFQTSLAFEKGMVIRVKFCIKYRVGSFNSQQISMCSSISPALVSFCRLFAQ